MLALVSLSPSQTHAPLPLFSALPCRRPTGRENAAARLQGRGGGAVTRSFFLFARQQACAPHPHLLSAERRFSMGEGEGEEQESERDKEACRTLRHVHARLPILPIPHFSLCHWTSIARLDASTRRVLLCFLVPFAGCACLALSIVKRANETHTHTRNTDKKMRRERKTEGKGCVCAYVWTCIAVLSLYFSTHARRRSRRWTGKGAGEGAGRHVWMSQIFGRDATPRLSLKKMKTG